MSRKLGLVLLPTLLLGILAAAQPARVLGNGNPNPGIAPNRGPTYGNLNGDWWKWIFSIPASESPLFESGAVDISAHQSGNLWYLAGSWVGPVVRSGTVPAGKRIFAPIVNYINDYPCPDPAFQPAPGESMEAFLLRTGNDALGYPADIFLEIDGVPQQNLADYRAASHLFTFQADASWVGGGDPCITGEPQPAVAIGYSFLLEPLTPGEHTLHFGYLPWGQDNTYHLTVTP